MHGGSISFSVYPSTSINELRAAMEQIHHYDPANQYFFVNGGLAYDGATMTELNVGPNSLFILFLLSQSKTFNTQASWKCHVCRASNMGCDLKCRTCFASRVD